MAKLTSRRAFFQKGALAAGIGAMAPLSTFGETMKESIEKYPKMASAPADLRITNVQVGFLQNRSLFVKINTNQDIYGLGEAVDAVGGTYHFARSLGNRLRNQNPLNVNRLVEQLKGGPWGGPQSGMYVAVLSAYDTALWDLAGKALGVPVYQLLGGKYRDSVRVYCDTAFYSRSRPTPADFANGAKETVKMGFTAVKFDLDEGNDPNKYDRFNWTASPGEINRMVEQVAAAREAVGPNVDICCDMHARYDLPTALTISKKLEPYNLMFLEEPIPAENVDAYQKIASETSTPICAGENVFLAHGFRRGLEIGAWDIVMPDLQKAGGLGEGMRIANLANLHYIPFSPHMVASYLGAMACAHVCAAVPNFMIMEWQIYFHNQPMWREIVDIGDEPFIQSNGFLKVSDKPGIGVDLNLEALKKYAPQGVPFFE